MTDATLFGLCGALVIGIGSYGLIAHANLVRRVLAFNLIGNGIFLLFGALATRTPEATDPVPQAMIITGIVVALAATAFAITLIIRLFETTGASTLSQGDCGDEAAVALPPASGDDDDNPR